MCCVAPGYLMIRQATEDTILTIPNARGEEGTRTIAIQKGAEVVVDMVGVREFFVPFIFKAWSLKWSRLMGVVGL